MPAKPVDAKPSSTPRKPDGGAQRGALIAIAVVVVGAAVYWLRDILTPLALAIFIMVMIESFTRNLHTRIKFLPEWAALVLAILTAIGVILLSAWIIAENAQNFVGSLSGYAPRLNTIIAEAADLLRLDVAPTLDQLFARLNPARYLTLAAQGLQSFTSNAVFVLVYLGFLIASRVGFERKVVRLFPEREDRRHALDLFSRVRVGVERYLWVQTVTGLMIAAASWGVMATVGLDQAFFWAFLIFLAGYIPIIGPLVGGLLPPIFGLVQFDGYLEPLVLLAALNAINFVVGNVVLPRMQGDSLNLDPVVVLLSLAFWGALWGVPGMFLSTPLAVVAMVVLAQFDNTRWIAILISGDGDPMGEEKTAQKQKRTPKTPSA